IAARVPEVSESLRRQLTTFVSRLRDMDLKKQPAVSETIDWARALVLMHADTLTPAQVESTLRLLLKYEEDLVTARADLHRLLKD
ncbi:MAG: MoxR family ATPase, partial [Candidatus Parvarchaeota archaeon]|nr:MoxR family ATPase [Candidatus Jingweiarchaeum tengchongense]